MFKSQHSLNIFFLNQSIMNREFSKLNGYENPSKINTILTKLNSKCGENIVVYQKEVAYKNKKHRNYETNEFATSSEMVRTCSLNRTKTNIFLVACSEPKGNIHTYDAQYKNTPLEIVARKNREKTIDWHSQAIVYSNQELFIYDNLFNIQKDPYKTRMLNKFPFRSKIKDFLEYAKRDGLPIKKIFACGHDIVANCRGMALSFIKGLVNATMNITFHEISQGNLCEESFQLLTNKTSI